MFGLSIDHIVILLLAGLFILGPERLPEAAHWVAQALKRARGFAAGAKAQLEAEIGPEYQELRKPLQELQSLRMGSPRAAVTRYLLDGTPPAPRPASTPPPVPLRANERPPVDPDAT
ncbi:Sec-independent protein translocase subunit TatB [Amycolatopsis rubida]|uniref:Sec-independent protein translocase subunit TatB n=1 Tax=Amycolatopsis rubida TaxID=112413 RepID=A0ABX0C2B9_9PSEU|nr:Sec-independent protein translocase subunit TatB [Amycolatopsis sp. M39]MYW95700.1 Sec-independent protein translocase subunit TatB [Amycolatopsis rubida]NEC60689.1 Sec-independent protein translocase subunit TatB [Amycolatopsis rubida]OAP22363.1 Sec-independent protein translocase protein TatB [Amycolatopsis sp. M39]